MLDGFVWQVWAYLGSLIVLCALVAFIGRSTMQRTAVVLAANWLVGTFFVMVTGIGDAWWFNILIDGISAAIVLHDPAGRAQAMVGWVYVGMIICHVTYGAVQTQVLAHMMGWPVNNPDQSDNYWMILLILAMMQLVIVGGWIAVDRGLLRRRTAPRLAQPARD